MSLPSRDQVVDIKGCPVSSEYIFPLDLYYIHLVESKRIEKELIGALR